MKEERERTEQFLEQNKMNSICKHRGEKTHSASPIMEIGISGHVRDEEKKPVVDQVL